MGRVSLWCQCCVLFAAWLTARVQCVLCLQGWSSVGGCSGCYRDVSSDTVMCPLSTGQPSSCGGQHRQPGHASICEFTVFSVCKRDMVMSVLSVFNWGELKQSNSTDHWPVSCHCSCSCCWCETFRNMLIWCNLLLASPHARPHLFLCCWLSLCKSLTHEIWSDDLIVWVKFTAHLFLLDCLVQAAWCLHGSRILSHHSEKLEKNLIF